SGGYGNYVLLSQNSDGSGLRTRYAHLDPVASDLKQGDPVSQGQIIGYVGSTGHSDSAHLHFEVIVSGNPTDVSTASPDAPSFYKGILAPVDRDYLNQTVHPVIVADSERTIAARPGEHLRLNLQGFDWNEGVSVELLTNRGEI